MAPRNGEKKRGIALIMALWLLTILAVVGSSFVFMMRTEVKLAYNYRNDIQAHYLARAGVEKAIALLRNDGGTTDNLTETWFQGWNGTWYDLGEGGYSLTVFDESGMVNINLCDKDFPIGAGEWPGTDGNAIEGATGDGIGEADGRPESLTALPGTGASQPTSGGPMLFDYRRDRKLFDTIREVTKVKNIGGQSFHDDLQDCITCYTTTDLVNLNTASYSVLRGLSAGVGTGEYLSATEINNIIANRSSNPVPADPSYTDLTTRFSQISAAEARFLTNEAPLSPSVDQVRGNSEGYFKIRSIGVVKDASGNPVAQKQIEAVVKRAPLPVDILYWSEMVFED